MLKNNRTRKSEVTGSETGKSEPPAPPIGTSLMGEVNPDNYPLRNIATTTAKLFLDQLTSGEAAIWQLRWQNAAEAFERMQTIVAKMIEKLPDLNEQIKHYNAQYLKERLIFKKKREKADKEIAAKKVNLVPAQADLDQAETAYLPAKTSYDAKNDLYQENEKAKKSLALVESGVMTLPIFIFIWVIRIVLGIALALSLGLIIGALNQYRPFTSILGVFWFIAFAILFNSGTVVHWLGVKAAEVMEARRYAGSIVSPGNKWTWLLISTIAFFSAIDAATLMFGAFRLLKVSGTAIPDPVLLLVCFIFIFPYLYMEARYGWSEGEKKIKKLKAEELIENEARLVNITAESLETEATELEKLRVNYSHAKAKVDEIDAEIKRIDAEPVMPEFRSPIFYGPGIYPCDAQWANATWSSELMAPPLNEELNIARRDFLDTYAKAIECEEDLIRKVFLRKDNGQKKTSLGFFARHFSH